LQGTADIDEVVGDDAEPDATEHSDEALVAATVEADSPDTRIADHIAFTYAQSNRRIESADQELKNAKVRWLRMARPLAAAARTTKSKEEGFP
jgi:hypothetical protein